MTHDDKADELVSNLPSYYPAAEGTGNHNLLKAVAQELDHHDEDISDIDAARLVSTAETMEQLKKLGSLVGLPPNEGETIDHYRARLRAEYSIVTCEGTIADVLETTSEIFDVDITNIRYEEPAGGEYGTVSIGIPGIALDNTQLSDQEASNIIERLLAASYRISGYRIGTFTYITPSDYDINAHDATLGYDGLDSNGDPKDNGGTYAGLLR
jgi:hypothetical protein